MIAGSRPTNAEAAVAYARFGLRVFPLWHLHNGTCTCDKGTECPKPGKHPRTRRGLNDATAGPVQVGEWWERWPLANIGLPCNANGLAVLDIDPDSGGDETIAKLDAWCLRAPREVDLTNTLTARTGSGGTHRVFAAPADGIKTGAATFGQAGVDTRGRGGYIVAAPSLHASGDRYVWLDEPAHLEPWPTCLDPLLDYRPTPAPRGVPTTRSTGGSRSWAQAGLDGECAQLAALVGSGQGRHSRLNGTAYKLARKIGPGMLDEHEVETALLDACRGWIGESKSDHTSGSIMATIRSGINAGKRNPWQARVPA